MSLAPETRDRITDLVQSNSVMLFMSEHNYKAPIKWAGFRELTDK